MIESMLVAWLLLIYIGLAKVGYKIGIIHLLMFTLMLKSIGLYRIGQDVTYLPFVYYNILLAIFLVGVFFSAIINHNSLVRTISPSVEFVRKGRLKNQYLLVYGLVFLLCAYHYSVVGIPLFSSEIEIARFSAAESGFYGLPSRVVNYSIIFILLSLLIMKMYRFIGIRELLILSIFPVIVILFSGSKAALFVVVHFLLLTNRLRKTRLSRTGIILLLISVLTYFAITFSLYETSVENSIFQYVFDRLTIINADTFDYIVHTYKDIYPYGNGTGLINDFLYPLYKLAGQDVVTVNTLISSAFYNVPASRFTVPVTPSIFGYFYLEFGFIISAILTFVVGYAFMSFHCLANKKIVLWSKILVLYVEYMLFIAIASGNPIYVFINYSVGVVILLALLVVSKLVVQSFRSTALTTLKYSFPRFQNN